MMTTARAAFATLPERMLPIFRAGSYGTATIMRAPWALLGLLMFAACASAPPTLIALPAPPAAPAPAADSAAGPTILLRHVSVPGYLDGFPVVTGRRGETLIVSTDAEWAERLADAAGRVLRAALSQRLGSGRVLIAGDGRVPDAELTVELLALDPLDGRLTLDARWSFVAARDERANRSGRTQLDVPLAAAQPSAVAAATAQALGELAGALAQEAATLPPRTSTTP
jgi:uncharacterized lipoprotein YmbA